MVYAHKSLERNQTIDDLAKHDGFTVEELNFIVPAAANMNGKYRMACDGLAGDDAGGDD